MELHFIAQLRLRIFYFEREIRFRPPAVRDEGRNKNLQRSKFMSTFMCDYKFWAPQSDNTSESLFIFGMLRAAFPTQLQYIWKKQRSIMLRC